MGKVLYKKLQSKTRKIFWSHANSGLARIQMFSGPWIQRVDTRVGKVRLRGV